MMFYGQITHVKQNCYIFFLFLILWQTVGDYGESKYITSENKIRPTIRINGGRLKVATIERSLRERSGGLEEVKPMADGGLAGARREEHPHKKVKECSDKSNEARAR